MCCKNAIYGMFSEVEILTCHLLHKYNKRSFFADLFIRRSLIRREVYFGEKFNSQRSLIRREVYFGEISLFRRDFFISEILISENFLSRRISYLGEFLISENFLSRRIFYFGELISENMRIFYCFFFGTNRWQHQINSVVKHIPGGAR